MSRRRARPAALQPAGGAAAFCLGVGPQPPKLCNSRAGSRRLVTKHSWREVARPLWDERRAATAERRSNYPQYAPYHQKPNLVLPHFPQFMALLRERRSVGAGNSLILDRHALQGADKRSGHLVREGGPQPQPAREPATIAAAAQALGICGYWRACGRSAHVRVGDGGGDRALGGHEGHALEGGDAAWGGWEEGGARGRRSDGECAVASRFWCGVAFQRMHA